MSHIKVLSILLFYLFTGSGYCAGPETPTAKSRKDSYDDILRPPPPPPPHLTPMRVHHHSHGQPRFQRHPRQPFHSNPPPFYHPHPPKSNEEQSFFQKMSNWLFTGSKDNSHQSSQGPPPSYGPPPVYGVPFSNAGPPIRSGPNSGPKSVYTPPNDLHPSLYTSLHNSGPPSTYGVPQNNPQDIVPHQTYGLPSTNSQSQYRNSAKKNCNPCNLYPWIPVLTYQTQKQKSPLGDQLTFNTNSILSSNSKYNEPIKNNDLPTQLTVPSDRPHGSYITPISNMSPSPPSIFPGGPFSLSQLALENNGPSPSKPLTNSYGAPIPSDTYGSPFPGTNDGTPIAIEVNKEHLEHLGTNNVPHVSRPTGSANHNVGKHSNNSHPINHINYDKGRKINILHPIPLPNLSPVAIPPLFNARPFVQSNNENSIGETHLPSLSSIPPNLSIKPNIQVLNSVPVAEFTSSVEYPISIIQSPLLDIDTSKSNNQQQNNEVSQEKKNKFNPIVVQNGNVKSNDDSYSAASGGNDHEFEDSEQDVVIYSTTESYKSTLPQFLPTPLVHNQDQSENGKYPGPTTLYPFVGYTSFEEDINGQFSQASTLNPYFQEYEEYSANIFKPADPDQLQAIDSPLLYLGPNVPHKESKPFKSVQDNRSTNNQNTRNSFASGNSVSSTVSPNAGNNTSGLKTTFRFIDNRAVPGKWPPTPEDENGESTKKPNRIQIIIPYTSEHKPTPFQFSANDVISSSGWIPMTDELGANYGRKVPPLVANQDAVNGLYTSNSLTDYHESSESKVVSSSASAFNSSSLKTPKQDSVTSVNIIQPHTTTSNQENKTSFDVMKLQKNIDEWTVQEFSKIYKKQQKASTISHLKRSKKIPDNYFTTVPSVLKTSKVLLSTINDLSSFIDNEAAGSFQHSVETDLNQPKSVNIAENEILEENPVTITSRPTYYVSTTYPTTYYIETTTLPPKTTTKHSWEKIITSISPLTKEKVYVVTPLPFDIENPKELNNKILTSQARKISNVTESIRTIRKDTSINLAFKSPRFLVRPTPGPTGSQRDRSSPINKSKNTDSIPISGIDWLHSINNLIDTTTTESASRSFFGLAAVTAYTPPEGSAVQTFSGHSKVVTVTPLTENASTST